MAIVQISQITNRLGLNIDLPQLAGAELGWSADTRQLYIGNGTLEQGAPVIGNTEILTEFSDILNLAAAYTYKGTAAGYTVQTGPTAGTPVTLSLQNWLDQFATVKDFGAKGDGLTDDTAAINRALNQLYCQQNNVQIRRSLFFPAGKYIVSNTINIPPYATLYGEGPENSIIQMVNSGSGTCVAQTADSLQQTGVNIGSGGATPPTDINIINMAFQSLDNSKNIFLIESATSCEFQGVSFIGPGTTSTLINETLDTSGVSIGSTLLPTNNILLNGCRFTGTTYGVNSNDQMKGVTIANSSFNILYEGVTLGTGTIINGGPTGTRITNNVFDNIYDAGITFGIISLNATGYNIFYDVGNHFEGTANPYWPVIIFRGDNNASIGDMFERTDAYADIFPRVDLNGVQSIASTNGSQIQLGDYTRKSGVIATLADNQLAAQTIFTISPLTTRAFVVNYTIYRTESYRTGSLIVTSMGTSTTVQYMDDYVENQITGIELSVIQLAEGDVMSVQYTSTSTGEAAQMHYSISYLNSYFN